MLFTSDSLTVEIFLFIALFVACKWVFRKSWLNQLLLIGGNVLILCHITTPKSLFLISLLALLAYGAGWLLSRRKAGWLLAVSLILLLLLFSIRNYPLVQSWLGS